MRRRKKRQTMEAEELRKFLKWKRIKCDCKHTCSIHNLSRTMVITTSGQIICSECYL